MKTNQPYLSIIISSLLSNQSNIINLILYKGLVSIPSVTISIKLNGPIWQFGCHDRPDETDH